MKKQKLLSRFVLSLAILFLAASPALSTPVSPKESASTTLQDSTADAQVKDSTQKEQDEMVSRLKSALKGNTASAKTFWELATAGGNVAYVILGVLVLGLIIIMFKAVKIVFDWHYSKELLKVEFNVLELPEIEAAVKKSHKSSVKQMLQYIFGFYRAGGDSMGIQQEVVSFIELKNDQFESYRSWVNFLSDSAGGLGLLGTVWGIFQTFFGGELDQDKILNGMAVALITTLFGVIVSLIINLGATQTYSSFSNRMENTADKGDELRLFLLQLDAKNGRMSAYVAPPQAEQGEPVTVVPGSHTAAIEQTVDRIEKAILSPGDSDGLAQPTGNGKKSKSPKISVHAVEPLIRSVRTGETVKKAIKLQAEDRANRPLEHTKICLETEGPIFFEGKKRELEIETDKSGHADVAVTGGEKIGSGKVTFWISGDREHYEIVEIKLRPSHPSQLTIQRGDNQPGRVGQRLTQPLQVLARDQFGNPVPDTEVTFRLAQGEGALNGGARDFSTSTNEFGITEADFTLSDKTGFHCIEASLKDDHGETVKFHILGTA